MGGYTFRHYEGSEDAERQYELWLNATKDLPRAWPSSRVNVRHHTEPAAEHPKARIYAERDGVLAGYIGTHAPFEWPPLGWTIPFGFPWTYPVDTELEKELYDRLFAITPETYPGMRRDAYVQRFRESWKRHVAFMLERGWKQIWRYPILARSVEAFADDAAAETRVATPDDLPAVCEWGTRDPDAKDNYDVAGLRESLDGGWLPWDSIYLVEGAGAFVVDPRPPWAEVKLFYAAPAGNAFDTLLSAAAATAGRLGAKEFYFTLEPGESGRMKSLQDRGFEEVDAGIYLVYELRRRAWCWLGASQRAVFIQRFRFSCFCGPSAPRWRIRALSGGAANQQHPLGGQPVSGAVAAKAASIWTWQYGGRGFKMPACSV